MFLSIYDEYMFHINNPLPKKKKKKKNILELTAMLMGYLSSSPYNIMCGVDFLAFKIIL